jgi:DNA-binding winged helix-turn-helix (wHTH) protein/TolB-like protein/tetratricopeptide (TPR) repeat protein
MTVTVRAPAGGADSDRRPQRPLRIGEWAVDPQLNELRHGNEAARVEPKAMDVLMLLAGRVGRVVSREELFAAVWPDVVVGDEALTQTINKLRKALGDNSRSPSYIETIAKRGYRLIAAVSRGEGAESAAVGAQPAAVSARAPGLHRGGRWAALIAGMGLAIAMAAGYLAFSAAPMQAVRDGSDTDVLRQRDWVGVGIVPFESLGVDPEQVYLARGITVNLVTDLSRLSGLRVIRQADGTIAAAATEGVQYRISGSVQRDGETLRIHVHLVDTRTGQELWSERFDRPFDDIFSVQDELTATLVKFLPAKVSDVERQRLAKRYTRSVEAYDYFLRGQALFLARRSDENEQARALYLKALELDPKFARAYAGLAMTYAMDYRLRGSEGRPSALDRALELAQTARAIDPDIPEVYWAVGFVHAQSRRHDQAIEALQQAIVLDPSFADAYALLGGILTYTGQPARSIELLHTALRLNPDAGYLYFLLLGRALLFESDPEQALINLRAASMRNPADVETRVYATAALVAAGDRRAAKWEADEIRALEPSFSTRLWLETYPMTSALQKARLTALMAEVNL